MPVTRANAVATHWCGQAERAALLSPTSSVGRERFSVRHRGARRTVSQRSTDGYTGPWSTIHCKVSPTGQQTAAHSSTWPAPASPSDTPAWKRAKSFGLAIVNFAIAFSAARFAMGSGRQSSRPNEGLSAHMMQSGRRRLPRLQGRFEEVPQGSRSVRQGPTHPRRCWHRGVRRVQLGPQSLRPGCRAYIPAGDCDSAWYSAAICIGWIAAPQPRCMSISGAAMPRSS
jgi:hypothetical protein